MIDLKQGDCLELMKEIPDKSVDAIVTDPPYEYLKHKLDRPFDEQAVFNEWDRIVKDDGFLVFFGRGASFHRWNYLLNEMGWKFKEEIVWDKRRNSNPFGKLQRVHETVSILTKTGNIKESRVPYIEKNKYDFNKIKNDLNRIKNALNNEKELEALKLYVDKKEIIYNREHKGGITFSGSTKTSAVTVPFLKNFAEGIKEQDIISLTRKNVKRQHPTQKPVRLMERLLFCTTDEGQTILDPFMGSGSTGVACINTNRNFIGYELQQDYFKIAEKRISDAIDARGLFATDE